ncbi:hypothetical protein HaLaN_31527 [Haematococcus lacustris]|uniref:Uncharacterized protein n=1 Tax=Haematococcus lacustris TaxID=44745 RepID=A0A6A0AIG8_HAELA|nr:hypothetical protein HaLaN_31527 [Haematococcus lacustris]
MVVVHQTAYSLPQNDDPAPTIGPTELRIQYIRTYIPSFKSPHSVHTITRDTQMRALLPAMLAAKYTAECIARDKHGGEVELIPHGR